MKDIARLNIHAIYIRNKYRIIRHLTIIKQKLFISMRVDMKCRHKYNRYNGENLIQSEACQNDD